MRKLLVIISLLYTILLNAQMVYFNTDSLTCGWNQLDNPAWFVQMDSFNVHGFEGIARVDYMWRQNPNWDWNFHNEGLTLLDGYNQVALYCVFLFWDPLTDKYETIDFVQDVQTVYKNCTTATQEPTKPTNVFYWHPVYGIVDKDFHLPKYKISTKNNKQIKEFIL